MSRKLTQKAVEEYCLERDYRVLSPYINNHTKIKLQNIKTGEIGEMRFGDFKLGSRFDNPKKTKKFTQQEVEEYCLEHGYKVLSRYVDIRTKIKLQNIETGAIGEMSFGHFKSEHRFDARILTYQQYTKPFVDEGYTVLIDEKYYKNVNVDIKIAVTCPNNHKWSVARNAFTSGNSRCPMCNQSTLGGMSIGEKFVYQLLQGNNINFEREKSIYIDGNRYRFDFYFEVEEFGNIDRFFIEYDGEQHYHEKYFGGVDQRRASDEIKDKYACDNNIQMIRIPWLNNTIDKVLFVINGETGLVLHSVNVRLPTIQQVTDYYLSHSPQETANKFNISTGTVFNYFKQIHGSTKKEYLSTPKQKEVSDYYLTHNRQQTMDKFNISDMTIRNYFKQIHGTTKTEYLGTLKQKAASDYYLTHTLQQTTNKFNITISTVTGHFNQAYGMSKREYLKAIDTTK